MSAASDEEAKPPPAPTVSLLDANVLIALTIVDHVHHEVIEEWFASSDAPFATCPITQGAFIRTVLRAGGTSAQARTTLHALIEHPRHRFWNDDVSFREVALKGVIGHRQVTDAYLAELARRHRGRLVTLDRGLAVLARDIVELLTP